MTALGLLMFPTDHHGVEPARRRALVREKVLAMRSLWTEEAGSYQGDSVSFSPSWSWPKPVQQPHPPIIMGGAGGPVTFRHVVEYGDGWMPIHGRRDIVPKLPELRAAAEAAGRDPATIQLGVFGCPPKPETIEEYAGNGFARLVLGLRRTAATPRWPRSTATPRWSAPTAPDRRRARGRAGRRCPGRSSLGGSAGRRWA